MPKALDNINTYFTKGVFTNFFPFLAYFIIGPDGEITAHSGVEPMDLRDVALGLLEDEL